MADFVFNIAKGRVAHFASLPATADALIIVLLVGGGLEADDTLNNYDDLAALLAATNDEATATNYVRKALTTAAITIDDVNNRVDVDIVDITWTALGGTTNNAIAKLLVCYDGDTAAGTDANIIPLTAHDFVVTTDGTDVTAVINAAGFFRAA